MSTTAKIVLAIAAVGLVGAIYYLATKNTVLADSGKPFAPSSAETVVAMANPEFGYWAGVDGMVTGWYDKNGIYHIGKP